MCLQSSLLGKDNVPEGLELPELIETQRKGDYSIRKSMPMSEHALAAEE